MTLISPAERTLRGHLAEGCFEFAVATGKWQVNLLSFPTLDVTVFGPNSGLGLRIDVTDYPILAPAGRAWNFELDGPLEISLWPTGGRADGLFRKDWSPQQEGALYFPLDRRALLTHPAWLGEKGPEGVWTSSKTIFDYLIFVFLALRGASVPSR
jgi:hypothetical protein